MDTFLKVRVATAAKARYERAAKATEQSLSEWVREGLEASADCDLNEGDHAAPKILPKDPEQIRRIVQPVVESPPISSSVTLTGRPHGPVPKGKK